METVLISGGSGIIGKHLAIRLKEKGYQVVFLSRSTKKGIENSTYLWDVENHQIENEAIEKADYIIHLAGANIGDKRWTKARKEIIINSRVQSCNLLLDKIKETRHPLKAFISASAIGYYGAISTEQIFTESDLSAHDFLGKTCKLWEDSADRFTAQGIRTVKIRTGVVLTSKGGALAKIIQPFKMYIGSAIGSGNQYIPWIHIQDLCNIYLKAIEDTTISGAYNAVAPDHKTNKEFISILARELKKPLWFPNIPSFALQLVFGKRAEMLLKGSRISSSKIIETGFHFNFSSLENAIRDLIRKK